MFDYERQNAVRSLLFRYLESPSLRHLRDPKQVDRLAESILTALDRTGPVWEKWGAVRGEFLKAAAKAWVLGSVRHSQRAAKPTLRTPATEGGEISV